VAYRLAPESRGTALAEDVYCAVTWLREHAGELGVAGDRIIFLRKVEPGKADRSYGIEVARLAGLPLRVIERAKEVLRLHECTEQVVTKELSPAPVQIQLFEPLNYGIAERIRNLNIDELRPVEALRLLSELQDELRRACV